MQIAKNDSMIISQHKRTCFDKDGSIAKVDILRCIRKKQAEPSFLPSSDQDQSKEKYVTENTFKEIIEYFLIAIIILCTVMLLLSLLGVSFSINLNQKTPKQTYSNQSTSYTNFSNYVPTFSFESQKNKSEQANSQRIYQRFVEALVDLSELQESNDKKNGQIQLNEFKNTMFQDQNQLWGPFLQKMVNEMSCKIQNDKIICQKLLKS